MAGITANTEQTIAPTVPPTGPLQLANEPHMSIVATENAGWVSSYFLLHTEVTIMLSTIVADDYRRKLMRKNKKSFSILFCYFRSFVSSYICTSKTQSDLPQSIIKWKVFIHTAEKESREGEKKRNGNFWIILLHFRTGEKNQKIIDLSFFPKWKQVGLVARDKSLHRL